MQRNRILSLAYQYPFRSALATCGVINNSGSAERQLCGLLILFYISVFSVMPLSHIHVEDNSTNIVNILDEHNQAAEGFLVFLHEVLFLHFKDRADHSSTPNSHFAKGEQGSRSLQNNQISRFTPRTIQCPDDYSSLPDNDVPYLFAGGHGPTAFSGFHSFNSSLSPPSA